jgi:transcriptional regulator with XRE-family HTH domain
MSTRFSVIPQFGYRGQAGAMLADRIRDNIVRLRESRGWSRPELGRRLVPPTSGSQIERLEKGWRSLEVDWVEKIARAFGIDPSELIAEKETYDLTPPAADAIASLLARFVLRGVEPDQEIVQGLSILLQEMSETFSRNPEARRDPLAARLAVDILARQHGPRAS